MDIYIYIYVFANDNTLRPNFNPLNAQLNSFYHLLALLGAHRILHVNRIRVKEYALKLL
jgi:hypothetical protein